MKVSVIIPIYNAGERLKVCLDSLCAQTLEDIEFILVLDCPTDGSDQLAKEYALNDSRFVIIENTDSLHTGFSRNEGIAVARGEYIGFCDHDDYCAESMFENLYLAAKVNNNDIVISNFNVVINDETIKYAIPNIDASSLKDNILESLISGRYFRANEASFDNVNSVWTELFKAEFLRKNDILFDDTKLVSGEDALFNLYAFIKAEQICLVNEFLYSHYKHSSNNYDVYDYKSYKNISANLLAMYGYLKKSKVLDKYKLLFQECVLRRLYISFRNELKFKGFASAFKIVQQIRRNKLFKILLFDFYNAKGASKMELGKRIFLFFCLR